MRMIWLLPIVAAMLPSCSVIPAYPESFPLLAVANTALEECPSIAGRFSDVGIATTPDGSPLGSVSLTQLLHPALPSSTNADAVVVRGPEFDFVEVESFREGTKVSTWRQPKVTKDSYASKGDRVVAETYLCQEGFVRLGRRYDVGGGGAPGLLIVGFHSDFLWLRKSVDGSLIVLHTIGKGAVINLALPVWQGDKIWYRFPSVTSPRGDAPNTQM